MKPALENKLPEGGQSVSGVNDKANDKAFSGFNKPPGLTCVRETL